MGEILTSLVPPIKVAMTATQQLRERFPDSQNWVVRNDTKLKSISAVIDTGFTGFLSFPNYIITLTQNVVMK